MVFLNAAGTVALWSMMRMRRANERGHAEGDNTTADAVGTLTIKGVAKEITAPVKFTYLKDKLAQRVPNAKGDLLVIRSTFTVKRSDFGINPTAPTDKVADDIELSLSVAGASAAQEVAAK